jgi:enoyl-CoA hydratase/carnithine racemase
MLFTGENIGAEEAMRIGLVERAVPRPELDAVVERWIDGICAATPEAIRNQKRLINRWQRSSVEESVLAGIDALADAYLTDEPHTAVASFFAAKATAKK